MIYTQSDMKNISFAVEPINELNNAVSEQLQGEDPECNGTNQLSTRNRL